MADYKELGLPLLNEEDDCACDSPRQQYPKNKRFQFSWTSVLIIYALVLSIALMYHVFAGFSISSLVYPGKASKAATGLDFVPSLYSPLDGTLDMHILRPSPTSWDPSKYFGEPDEESEYAWEGLLGSRGYQVSADEAKKLQIDDSIKLMPGTNYATLLGVTHNLHCLRRIRQTLYPGHYYDNRTQEFWEADWHHNLHCMETIRQSLMCYPDLNPYPYYWSNEKYHPISVSPHITKQCTNWDTLQDHINHRAFRYRDMMRGTGPSID